MLKAIALMIPITVLGLGSCRAKDDSTTAVLSDGSFNSAGVTCAATGNPPAYPNATAPTALLDFIKATEHTLTVQGQDITETIVTPTCTIAVARKIFANLDTQIILQLYTKYTLTPAKCNLFVTVDKAEVAAEASSFVDVTDDQSNSRGQSIDISVSGANFTFVPIRIPNFGCGDDGIFHLNWVKT